ncbi:MAG TPA: hypothetical protein VGR09_08920 [Gemmatimonadales bacterium]|nr:hypothetical protein [Gemmatimonadales bacterium]
MHFPWTELLVAACAALSATPGNTQQIGEIGIQGIVTSSDPALVVVGPYGALRTSGRTRVSASAGGGASDGAFAWRAEALGHFLLSPDRRHGWGVYVAGGLAAVGGPVNRGYIVLTLGAEGRPGGSSGWVAEVGIGGGVRIGLGYRWRRFPRTWRK